MTNYSARFVKCQSKCDSYWVVYDSNNNTVLLKSVEEIVGPTNVDGLYDIVASHDFGNEILECLKTLGISETVKLMSYWEWDNDWFPENDDELVDTERIPNIIQQNIKPKGQVGDGMLCQSCKNVFPLAAPNQPDGSFICYKCRNNL